MYVRWRPFGDLFDLMVLDKHKSRFDSLGIDAVEHSRVFEHNA